MKASEWEKCDRPMRVEGWERRQKAILADLADREHDLSEALRDVKQLHDAALETEDKMDALKAERDSEHEACEAAVRQWNRTEVERNEARTLAETNGYDAEVALVRAEKAEAERDRLQHIIDCADTPLMRDVMAERDEYKRKARLLRDKLQKTYTLLGGILLARENDIGYAYIERCAIAGREDIDAALRETEDLEEVDARKDDPGWVTVADYDAVLAVLRQCVELVEQAVEACTSENMCCPWCSGHLRSSRTVHDQFCKMESTLAAARKLLEEEAAHSYPSPKEVT